MIVKEDYKYLKLSLITIFGTTIIRLFLISGNVGLGDAEAYYWTWSQNLRFGYYDHPPMIAYILAFFTWIGDHTPFWVRLGPTILFTLTSINLFLITKKLFNVRAAFIALILLNVTPVFSFGGISASPDTPFGFFWTTWLLLLLYGLNNPWLMVLGGFVIGLGFLSKYFMLLSIPLTLVVIFKSGNKKYFKHPAFYIAILVAIISSLPVIYNEYINGWPSLLFHTAERHGSFFPSINFLTQTLGGQILYVSPIIYFILLYTLYLSFKRSTKEYFNSWSFVFWTSFPYLAFFYIVMSCTREAEPHWPVVGYLPLLSATAALIVEQISKIKDSDKYKKDIKKSIYRLLPLRIKFLWITGAGLPLLLLILVHVHIFTNVFFPLLPNSYKPKYDLSNELFGWDVVGEQINSYLKEISSKEKNNTDVKSKEDNIEVASYHYTMCSQAMFSLKNKPVYCLNKRKDQFDYFGLGKINYKKSVLFFNDNRYNKSADLLYDCNYYKKLNPLILKKKNKVVRQFYFTLCQGYKGLKK